MQTSVRNQFSGQVASLKKGPINAEVTVDIEDAASITALITVASADHLGLREGSRVYALIKASSVIIVPYRARLRLSTRNQLAGTVVRIRPGPINADITLRLQGGQIIAAVITSDSAARLALKEGDRATAAFKSSSVILAVDSGD